MKDGCVGEGTLVCSSRSGAIVVFVSGRHDGEVEVREEGRVLVEVCEASGGKAREW